MNHGCLGEHVKPTAREGHSHIKLASVQPTATIAKT
jgi:hypothetical protein